jgi:hypothetical protein
MWGRRRKLEGLYEELKAIAILERLCDTGTNPNGSDDITSQVRQRRQSEILAEIAKLENTETRSLISQADPASQERQCA